MNNSAKNRFSDAEREAVYRVIAERRDMRHFSSEPIDEPTLWRLLPRGAPGTERGADAAVASDSNHAIGPCA